MKPFAPPALVFGLLVPTSGIAQNPGELDPTFATDGIAITDINDTYEDAWNMVVQPDDRIVVSGMSDEGSLRWVILRYLPDGEPDPSFNGNGYVVLPTFDAHSESVALQSDGKIVACGGGPGTFALARLNTDGSIDQTFADDGVLLASLDTNEGHCTSIAVDGEDRIVAAGWASTDGGSDLAIFRCLADGSPDPAFGTNGWVTATLAEFTFVWDMALQPDGKILVCGGTYTDNVPDIFVARFTEQGDPDPSFGTDGVSIWDATNDYDEAMAVAVQADGAIVLTATTSAAQDFLVLRMRANGTPDPTFDSDGIVLTDIDDDSNDASYGIMVQPDQRIVVTGVTSSSFAIARYMPDGSLDASFSNDGMNAVSIEWGCVGGTGVGMQSNGRIIAVGRRWIAKDEDIVVYGFMSGMNVGINEPLASSGMTTLRPNPVDGSCVVDLKLEQGERINIRLVDATGRDQLPTKDLGWLSPGEHRCALDLSALATGTYILLVSRGGTVSTTKVLKR